EKGKSSNNEKPTDSMWVCYKCGSPKKHHKDKCPAKDVECRECGKNGHYARVCKNKKTHQASSSKVNCVSEEIAFLGAIEDSENRDEVNARWSANVLVENVPVYFKLDPGAEVTVIPELLFQSKLKSLALEKSDRQLCGPSRDKLETLGMIRCKISVKDKE
ncbi:unnamed protein product, partial [Allacma fusca]